MGGGRKPGRWFSEIKALRKENINAEKLKKEWDEGVWRDPGEGKEKEVRAAAKRV